MLLGTPALHDAPLLLLDALGPEPLRFSPLHGSHMSVSIQGLRLGAAPPSHPQQLELLATGPAELYQLRFPQTARLTKQLSRLLARSVLTYSAEDNSHQGLDPRAALVLSPADPQSFLGTVAS